MEGLRLVLGALQGGGIPPGVPHQMINNSASDVEFLVVSQPMSEGDRHQIAGRMDLEEDGAVK